MKTTIQVCLLLSTGTLAIVLGFTLLRRWGSYQDQSVDNNRNASKAKRRKSGSQKGIVNYKTLSSSVNTFNPQLTVVLKYLVEKSVYKEHQILMSESGCIENVSDVLQTTNNPDIKILCLKVFMNVSTNPDFLNEFLLPITPYLLEAVSEDCEDILGDILGLLVNVSSHEGAMRCYKDEVDIIAQTLSRYTQQINYHYDVVLNCLKILINLTCTDIVFELSLVYMSLIHLLFGCKNNDILLRVLTLLRNILTSTSLKHDYTYDDELIRGVATVLSSNMDKDCIDVANQIYRIISDH